jgi:dihydrofolate reductase
MSKLMMWNRVTPDGLFEGAKSWELDFHQSVWDDELERLSIEQLGSADGLLFGRVTHEGMAAYWQTATGEVADFMNRLRGLTNTPARRLAQHKINRRQCRSRNQELKLQGEKNIFALGSANLSATLIQHNLFDEYRIAVAPVRLGRGKPLFQPNSNCLNLKLLDSRTLSNGCVILRYLPQGTH